MFVSRHLKITTKLATVENKKKIETNHIKIFSYSTLHHPVKHLSSTYCQKEQR